MSSDLSWSLENDMSADSAAWPIGKDRVVLCGALIDLFSTLAYMGQVLQDRTANLHLHFVFLSHFLSWHLCLDVILPLLSLRLPLL